MLKIIDFQSLDDRAWISANEPECESASARKEVEHLNEVSRRSGACGAGNVTRGVQAWSLF